MSEPGPRPVGRYEARDSTGVYAGWEVVEIIDSITTRYVVPTCQQWEAEVMAFALNVVGNNDTLVKLIPPDRARGARYAGFYCQDYDGARP